VSNRIKVLREARGVSLEALAAKMGTSNQQVSLLETGKRRLTVDWLHRLARALDCHPWEVVSDNLPQPLEPRDIRLLSRFRTLTDAQQDALLQLLDVLPPPRRRRRNATATE
jgi:transcriptional regulator with XRE-family HTH domain